MGPALPAASGVDGHGGAWGELAGLISLRRTPETWPDGWSVWLSGILCAGSRGRRRGRQQGLGGRGHVAKPYVIAAGRVARAESLAASTAGRQRSSVVLSQRERGAEIHGVHVE